MNAVDSICLKEVGLNDLHTMSRQNDKYIYILWNIYL